MEEVVKGLECSVAVILFAFCLFLGSYGVHKCEDMFGAFSNAMETDSMVEVKGG